MRCTSISLDTVSLSRLIGLHHGRFAFVCIVNELLLIPPARRYLHLITSKAPAPFMHSLLTMKHSVFVFQPCSYIICYISNVGKPGNISTTPFKEAVLGDCGERPACKVEQIWPAVGLIRCVNLDMTVQGFEPVVKSNVKTLYSIPNMQYFLLFYTF